MYLDTRGTKKYNPHHYSRSSRSRSYTPERRLRYHPYDDYRDHDRYGERYERYSRGGSRERYRDDREERYRDEDRYRDERDERFIREDRRSRERYSRGGSRERYRDDREERYRDEDRYRDERYRDERIGERFRYSRGGYEGDREKSPLNNEEKTVGPLYKENIPSSKILEKDKVLDENSGSSLGERYREERYREEREERYRERSPRRSPRAYREERYREERYREGEVRGEGRTGWYKEREGEIKTKSNLERTSEKREESPHSTKQRSYSPPPTNDNK